MKHAFLILAHSNISVLEELIGRLKDDDFYLYIHMDKKNKKVKLFIQKYSKYPRVFFVERIRVKWGSFSVIKATLILLEESRKMNFDYYHLISGDSLPIKSNLLIKKFFEDNKNTQFISICQDKGDLWHRITKFHFFTNYSKVNNKIEKIYFKILNHFFKLFYRKNPPEPKDYFYKSSQWFDITSDFADLILIRKKWIAKTFRFGDCVDELFIATILMNSKFKSKIKPSTMYVDWQDIFNTYQNRPITLTKSYINVLKESCCLFARKFDSSFKSFYYEIIKK